jgi:hypothetical protein
VKFLQNIKVNKKVAIFSVVVGMAVSVAAPQFDFDFPLMREGIYWGLAFGIFWSMVRFYLHGVEGVYKSQREITAGTFYLAMFMTGYFAGWSVQKLIFYF